MHHGIPFYVAAPLTSVDLSLSSGQEIVIEERSPKELLHTRGGLGEQVAASGILVWNPAFDVTQAKLISGIITEKVSLFVYLPLTPIFLSIPQLHLYGGALGTLHYLCSGQISRMISLISDYYLNRVSSRRMGQTLLILLGLCARQQEICDAGFVKCLFS